MAEGDVTMFSPETEGEDIDFGAVGSGEGSTGNVANSNEWYGEHLGLRNGEAMDQEQETGPFVEKEPDPEESDESQAEHYSADKTSAASTQDTDEKVDEDVMDTINSVQSAMNKLANSKQGIGQALTAGVSNVENSISAGAMSVGETAGNIVGSAVGTAGAMFGAAQGLGIMVQGTAAMAADLVSSGISDVISYTTSELTTKIVGLIKPPTVGEIMDVASKKMAKIVKEKSKNAAKKVITKQDDEILDKTKQETMDKLAATSAKLMQAVETFKSKIEEAKTQIRNALNQCKKWQAQGVEWMQKTVNHYTDEMKAHMGEIINARSKELMEVRKQGINALGNSLGTIMGNLVTSKMFYKIKKTIDDIREAANQVVLKAKALIHKALCNLLALIGA